MTFTCGESVFSYVFFFRLSSSDETSPFYESASSSLPYHESGGWTFEDCCFPELLLQRKLLFGSTDNIFLLNGYSPSCIPTAVARWEE